MKTQAVRLVDVFLLGPLMILRGARARTATPLDTMLVLTGILTIIYNGGNYLAENQRRSQ